MIWEQYERQLAPLREQLSAASGSRPPAERGGHRGAEQQGPLEEWQVPRERPDDWPPETEPLLAEFWELRIARQRQIDASIAAKADYEYLYDQPYEDRKTVRVAGPFTVESISPHRTLAVDADGEFIEGIAEQPGRLRLRLCHGHPRKPEDRRRPAGAQGRPHRVHLPHALARLSRLRRGPGQWSGIRGR